MLHIADILTTELRSQIEKYGAIIAHIHEAFTETCRIRPSMVNYHRL